MNDIKILSKFKEYSVEFSASLQALQSMRQQENTFFVFDKKVYGLYEDLIGALDSRCMVVEALETNKNIETALAVCEKMTNMPSKRNTLLVSVGGGIIQDITGFAANILYRGVGWVFFPTTLLAACDSCIGGKSSLNFKSFKNLLGSFYPPDRIVVFKDFFKTLSFLDYCSGLGEAVKFNIIAGSVGLEKIESKIDALVARDMNDLLEFIRISLEFKKQFIEEDEFDKGRRILLNFAHTFGHAFETAGDYAIPHGIAVTLGMITANAVSVRRNLLHKDIARRIENVCMKIIPLALRREWFDIDRIINAVKKDKKQEGESIKAILLHSDFSLNIHNDITRGEISCAVEHLLEIILPPPRIILFDTMAG